MGFGTPQIISQETVEDTNPDLYARRAENELSQRRIGSAINEIDRAIKYSGRNVHYIYEKVKILFYGRRYGECYYLISKNKESFKRSFSEDRYKELIKIYMKSAIKSGQFLTLLKMFIKPVSRSQVVWLIGFTILSYIIYRTNIIRDLLSDNYIRGSLGRAFYGVGPGFILGSLLGPIYLILVNILDVHYIFMDWKGICLFIYDLLTIFIVGGLSNIIGLLCKKNMTKYIFTVLLIFSFGDYIRNLIFMLIFPEYMGIFPQHGFIDFIEQYHYYHYLSSDFWISLLVGSLLVFFIKKVKKDY